MSNSTPTPLVDVDQLPPPNDNQMFSIAVFQDLPYRESALRSAVLYRGNLETARWYQPGATFIVNYR